MDNITSVSFKAFVRYFNTLSELGYKSYNDVAKLLVISLIEELLTGKLSSFITEEDYRSITNVGHYIIGDNCLVTLPSCK